MALESLAALSLAGNIVQFIDFGCRLFSKSRELYRSSSGVLAENVELENIANSLIMLSEGLTDGSSQAHPGSLDYTNLTSLAKDCESIATELLEALGELKVKDPQKKWQCFRTALKRIWRSERIENVSKRLDRYSRLLTTCMVKILHTENSSVLSSLKHLVEASGQQDLQRNLEFKELKWAGLEAVRELQEIHELHSNLLDDGRSRDFALTESMRSLSTKLDKFMKFGSKIATEHMILESLRYKCVAGRIFVDWLAHGNEVFWIKGKAGSGKSTLMKFVSHHQETKRALEPWSKEQKLVVASFYFWSAGSESQKSQEGLLQSLLYEILGQCPESIPVAFPQRWERCFCNQSSSSDWTRNELFTALKNLTSRPVLSSRFCFFIDGLDEYHGDPRDLIDLIRNFTRSEDIKWCLSSRPWNVFEAAFGNGTCPQLRLEDLTREDIRQFVRDKLEDDEAFRNLRKREGEQCDRLVNEVVQRAHGVFLWVFLVVRSLTSGLANADRIVDLQRRLDSLPDDLEEYFQHMLNTMDPNYSQQAAQIFQVALEALEPLTLMTYSMLDELETNPDFALNLELQVMPKVNVRSRNNDMKLRINARCKDLLEVTRISTSLPESFLDYQVDFLHRTVRDFFHTRHMYDWVGAHVSEGFNCSLSLCAAFVAQIKTVTLNPDTSDELQTLSDLVIGMAHYAHRIEVHTGIAPTALLDSLLSVFRYRHMTVFTRNSLKVTEMMRIPEDLDEAHVSIGLLYHSTLAFAIHHDLRLYVAEKLDNRWGHMSLYNGDDILVKAALHAYHSRNDIQANHEMLSLLVSKGVVATLADISSFKLSQIACNTLHYSWAEMTHSLSNPNIEQLNGSLESGVRFAQRPRILQWVMGVLKSLNHWWTLMLDNEEGSSHQKIMTEVMVTVLQRGVSPNWSYGKCTPWIYFVVSLKRRGSASSSRSCALTLAKEFVRCGALLEHDMSVAFDELTRDVTDTDIPWDGSVTHSKGKLPASELLQKVFPEAEMKELTSVGMADKQETAQDAKKRREKQKEKKKRRKRRKRG